MCNEPRRLCHLTTCAEGYDFETIESAFEKEHTVQACSDRIYASNPSHWKPREPCNWPRHVCLLQTAIMRKHISHYLIHRSASKCTARKMQESSHRCKRCWLGRRASLPACARTLWCHLRDKSKWTHQHSDARQKGRGRFLPVQRVPPRKTFFNDGVHCSTFRSPAEHWRKHCFHNTGPYKQGASQILPEIPVATRRLISFNDETSPIWYFRKWTATIKSWRRRSWSAWQCLESSYRCTLYGHTRRG